MPTISVIVPIYKVESYLRQCVDSILGQTFRDFELILVDDGSPDGCPAICDDYARQDERIVVIHQKNSGLSAARNAGLDIAGGAFIFFVDSDDWIAPTTLERMLSALQAEQADMALCNIKLAYPPDYPGEKNDRIWPIADESLETIEMVDKLMLPEAWFYIVACNKLYRREIFDGLRFPVGYIHEDAAVIHRVIGRCGKIVTLSEQLYFYRQVATSITGQGLRVQTSDKLYAYADRIRFAHEKGWDELETKSIARFVFSFFDFYLRFPRTAENERYFRRMEANLKLALPYILRDHQVCSAHKLYLSLIRHSPRLYAWLRTLKRHE